MGDEGHNDPSGDWSAGTSKSKETRGQTRGLSNLEMKHVGKLAIIGALLKAVKTSCTYKA